MNLLITGAWDQAGNCIEEIEKAGHAVRFLQYEKDDLPCPYEWVEGVVCNGLFLYHPIEKFGNLKYIQLTSAGLDRIPVDYIREHLIELHNARGVYSIPMAEFAVAGVLQLYKQMDYFRANQSRHEWKKHRGLLELFGKTVGIVGCGSVGTECAKRFQAFGCNVIGVDLFPREDKNYGKMVPLDQLERVLRKTDVLVLTLPLTEQTRHLISAEELTAMKPGAVLVNIARGAVVDPDALAASLDKLGGAVLDVFEEEPPDVRDPLWERANVILTPHNSFVGDKNQERLKAVILDHLWRANGNGVL